MVSLVLLFLSSLVSFHLRLFLRSRSKDSRSGRLMGWIMAATASWAFSNGLEILSQDLWAKLVWANIQYISITVLPVLWFRFGTRLLKKDEDSKAKLGQKDSLIWIIPMLTIIFVWLDPWLGLVRHDFSLQESAGVSYLVKTFGFWFWIHSAFSYFLILLATYRVVAALGHRSRRGTYQAWILVGAALVPTGVNFFYLLGYWPLPMVDPTPIAFSITGLLFVLNLSRFKFLALIPAAQEAVIASLSEGVLILDRDKQLVFMNEALTKQVGMTRLDSGRTWDDLKGEYPFLKDLPESVEGQSHSVAGEITTGEGASSRIFEVRLAQIKKGNSQIATGYTFYEITQRVRINEELEHRIAERTSELTAELDRRTASERQLFFFSLHDSLTRLPNRSLLINRISQVMERYRREPAKPFALLYIDFDNFKQVNDTYGHEAGDTFLREISQRLITAVRTVDTVSRIGGDEFVVLLDKVNNNQEAVDVADRIAEELSVPINYGTNVLIPSASVGVLPSSTEYNNPEDLLRDADLAMYQAKNTGKNKRVLFESSMRLVFLERTRLTNDLKTAIVRGELELHYQPIIRMRDRTIVGCEALVRWNHPELGRLSPDKFIPLAEDSGLIIPLGLAVFIEACQMAFHMKETFPHQHFFIAVNVSALQLAQSDFAEVLSSTLSRHGLRPSAIHLEITESALVEQSESVIPMLKRLQDHGFKFKLDDFGTGYSSLAYLHRFPIDTIKIDRSFVMGLDDSILQVSSGPTEGILKGIISLGHELGKDIVAEGIETDLQANVLTAWSCDFGQGYLFGKPMPREKWMEVLRNSVESSANKDLVV